MYTSISIDNSRGTSIYLQSNIVSTRDSMLVGGGGGGGYGGREVLVVL